MKEYAELLPYFDNLLIVLNGIEITSERTPPSRTGLLIVLNGIEIYPIVEYVGLMSLF